MNAESFAAPITPLVKKVTHVRTTNILKDESSELDIGRYLVGKEKLNASFTAFATE